MLVTEQHPGRVAVGGWCSRGEVSCPLGVVAVVVVCSRPGDKDEPGQRVTADPRGGGDPCSGCRWHVVALVVP